MPLSGCLRHEVARRSTTVSELTREAIEEQLGARRGRRSLTAVGFVGAEESRTFSRGYSCSPGPLAHPEEQGTFNPKVPGSRPGRPTNSSSAREGWARGTTVRARSSPTASPSSADGPTFRHRSRARRRPRGLRGPGEPGSIRSTSAFMRCSGEVRPLASAREDRRCVLVLCTVGEAVGDEIADERTDDTRRSRFNDAISGCSRPRPRDQLDRTWGVRREPRPLTRHRRPTCRLRRMRGACPVLGGRASGQR